MDELAMMALIVLLLLLINQVATRDDGPDRIPNWEKRSREDKGIHDGPADLSETPRHYRR